MKLKSAYFCFKHIRELPIINQVIFWGPIKFNFKFSACFLKTLPYPKDCSESRSSNFCSGFPSLSLVHFLSVRNMPDFRNNFQDHRRLLEQLYRVTGGNTTAGTSFLKKVIS
jgi:hypothetical protein